jgi:hypothetical protein
LLIALVCISRVAILVISDPDWTSIAVSLPLKSENRIASSFCFIYARIDGFNHTLIDSESSIVLLVLITPDIFIVTSLSVQVTKILLAILFARETFNIHLTVELDIPLGAIEVVTWQILAA